MTLSNKLSATVKCVNNYDVYKSKKGFGTDGAMAGGKIYFRAATINSWHKLLQEDSPKEVITSP